jgi:hypothetical protein
MVGVSIRGDRWVEVWCLVVWGWMVGCEVMGVGGEHVEACA